jgi:nitroreductase
MAPTTADELPAAAIDAARAHDVPLGPQAPVMEVMATMRAMRRLRPDPVARKLLERLLEAASWAPTGGNSQTYGYVIVDDRATMQRCGEIWRRTQRFYSASQEPMPPPHTTKEKWRKLHDALRYQAAHFDETPALVIFTCDLSGELVSKLVTGLRHTLKGYAAIGLRDTLRSLPQTPRFLSTAESSSIYPGVENFLIAARAHGLAATLTTWHTMFEPEWRRTLGLGRRTKIYAVVPVGWPLGNFGPVVRRPVAERLRYTG